jgi:peptidyl-prolyl cis-trans isomerase D
VSKFRKYAGFVIMFALMGMLIISFALWGIGDMLKMGAGGREVAHVGGTHIPLYGWVGGTSVSVEEVRERFNRQIEQIQRQTGQRPEPEQALRYGLHVRALEDVVQRAVIDNAMQQYGLIVSEAEVRAAIARNPTFQGTTGSFDPLKYRALLQQARIPEAAYVADIRREIASTQLFSTVRTEGLAPASFRDDIFKMEGEKRVAETVHIPDAIILDIAKPTAEQLGTYFDANKSKFQIPEYRAFSYVLMTVDDVMGQVSVTPDQVKQEYEARASEFGSPEKRDVDQAMVDSEDKAKKIIEAAKAGKSLEDAAKDVLGNADGVIKLGPVLKKDLPAGPLADGVFAAAQGIAPEPIKSALGWHVIRLNAVEAGKVTPFEQVKDKIELDLKAQLAPDLLIKLVTDFERSLSKTQSMVASAQEFNLKVRTVEAVDARGQDASGKQLVMGPAASELVQAAFATRESSESQLLETQKGEYFVVRTDRVTPARVPPLSEVEPKVVESWQAEERRKLVDQKVKEVVEKVNAGGNLAEVTTQLAVATFYQANKERFRLPEHRTFSYVAVTKDEATGRSKVTPEQLKEEFERRAADFRAPETRDVDWVTTDDEAKAKEIIAQTKTGMSLEDAAKHVLGNSATVVKHGPAQKKDLSADGLADGAFAAAQGVVPEPVKAAHGWHVVRVNKIERGAVAPLDDVKDRLETDLKAKAGGEILPRLVAEFEASLGKTRSLAASAQELGLKLHTVEGVDANGRDASGKPADIGPAAAELLRAAFATGEGTDSPPIKTPSGEFFVVRTDRVVASRVVPMAEVSPGVLGNVAEITKRLGLDVHTSKPVTRYEADAANYLTQPATLELFKLPVGKAQSVRNADGSVIVLSKEIQAADLAKEKDTVDRFGKQLDTMIANDLVAQLLGALRSKYGVTVNDQVFAAAFASQQQQ